MVLVAFALLIGLQTYANEAVNGDAMINAIDLKVLVFVPTLNGMVPIWGESVAKPHAVNLIIGTIIPGKRYR